jgi:hypothetical protein
MSPKKRAPKRRSGGSGGASSGSVKPVRLAHWRADGNPKVRYRTEAEANKAAFSYRLDHGADLNAYECEFCGGWHLGASDDR